jgi:hypothetical protein
MSSLPSSDEEQEKKKTWIGLADMNIRKIYCSTKKRDG